ncbi:hypothetical protein AGMMS50230_20870 [Spirochaetia bacterium]|nr:hypothetical protein AGMMS50230_20870 [Spirochaetia bacterium]
MVNNNASQSPENIVNDITFMMDMEDMPLNEQEKQRLCDCISGKVIFTMFCVKRLLNMQRME